MNKKTNEAVELLVDELNELGLPNMALKLGVLSISKDFLNKSHLDVISELISSEYGDKISKRYNNRLRHAKLIGCPNDIDTCVNSEHREYQPSGITELLASTDFISAGMNVCILGASDSGKTYLAKALGIKACNEYKVEYYHCEQFLADLVNLDSESHDKYNKKIKLLEKLDLLILDDFLLNTIMDEREVKVLFRVLEARTEKCKSTIVCSQREPKSWASMIQNDEVAANAILKRATKHYTVVIKTKQS